MILSVIDLHKLITVKLADSREKDGKVIIEEILESSNES